MTVAELIKHLQSFDGNLPVIYEKFSEMVLLEVEEVNLIKACAPRPDGWIHRSRQDKPEQQYVCFPGN